MSALILKSGNSLTANAGSLSYSAYKQRVLADGGTIQNESEVIDAFGFVQINNINPQSVFSACSVRWGVKMEDGLPVKLYNLFDPTGDLVLIIGTRNKLTYEEDLFDFPVLRSAATSSNRAYTNGYVTLGSRASFNSLAVLSVTKLLPEEELVDGTTYSVATVASTELGVGTPNMHQVRLRVDISERPTLSKNYIVNGNAVSGTVPSPLGSAATWGSGVVFTDKSNVVSYSGGVETERNETIWKAIGNKDIMLTAMMSRGASSTEILYEYTAQVYFVESWCLIDVNESAAKALSERASMKYPS